MSKPNDVERALVRLTEAVQAYVGGGMIVDAEVARELRQALKAAQRIVEAVKRKGLLVKGGE